MPRYMYPVQTVVVGEKREIAAGYLSTIGDLESLVAPVTAVDPDGVLTITNVRINTTELTLTDPCGKDIAHRAGTVVLFMAEDFVEGSKHEVLITVATTGNEVLSDTVVLQESAYTTGPTN